MTEAEIIFANVIVVVILIGIVSLAIGYIVRAKKRGQGCIGCPNASKCGKHCSCGKKSILDR